MTRRIIWIRFFVLLLMGCSSRPDQFGGLDVKKWRADRGACNGKRTALAEDFKVAQKQLMGKFIDDVGEILGRPDIHQLGERNQKFYIYFLEKGVQCNDLKIKSSARKVILRFNAVGLLSEITYQTQPL